MADSFDYGSRMHLSPPPHQISKDAHGFDNSIPLSPQWLLSKPAESKPGIGAGGNCVNHHIPYGNPSDMLNFSGNSEDLHETHKKKDVFRPSKFEAESNRHDCWRDEERDNRSLVHKDRWSENSSARHLDARRMTSVRWGDSNNKDSNYHQRRESKWNTRWGPDRDFESTREKLNESGKYGDMHLDKGLPHISNHGKDEREEEQTRSWRSSSVQSHGRTDSTHNQSLTPNKQLYTVSHGRGHGENTQPLFSRGLGWFGSGGSTVNVPSHSQPQGPNPGEVDSGHGEPNPSRYSRTKLLDVYKVTNLTALRKSIDDFVQVPPITLDEPLDPLALCAPNSKEMTALQGIEKGDVTGGGAPRLTKDPRNSTKLGSSTLQGSREDLSFPYDECKDGSSECQKAGFLNYSEEASGERLSTRSNSNVERVDGFRDEGHDKVPRKTADEVPTSRELSLQGSKRSHSLSERSNGLVHDSREISSDTRQRNSDIGWPRQSKDPHNHWQGHMIASSDSKDLADWKNSEDPIMKRQPSGSLDRELEARKISQTYPEELSLLYKDPQGQIQGPFKGIDIIGWFEAGYFGIDLPVCLDSVLGNSPWSTLGDVMPHLQAKVRLPPGFSVPKQNEFVDVHNRLSTRPLVSSHSGLTEFEMLGNDASHRQGPKTEAENPFLELLMSSNMNNSSLDSLALSEGFQSYVGNNPGNMMQPVVDNGNNVYLLAKRMALERQRSLTNPNAYWTGKDATSIVSKPEYVSETLTQQAKLLSLMDESVRQHPQNADMISILQGFSDKPPSGINNGAPGWSKFPVKGGLDSLQNKIGIPPQVPFGFQQQRQPQNQPSLTNLLAAGVDDPSGILTAEKLLSSGLPQDPQLLNMLQQQHLMSHTGMPTPQMSPLDKMLLLKQQQWLRQQQQQQQLLSQVLSEHQSYQRFVEPSFGQLPAGGLTSLDPSQLQQTKEFYHIVLQAPISGLQDDRNNMVNTPSKYVQEVSQNIVSEPSSLHLPHQLYGSTTHEKSLDKTLLEPLNVVHREESLAASKFVKNLSFHEITNGSKLGTNIFENPLPVSSSHVTEPVEKASKSTFSDDPATAFSEDGKNPISVKVIPSAAVITIVDGEVPPSTTEDTTVSKVHLSNSFEEQQTEIKKQDTLSPGVAEVPEPKKSSNKKSKKQKSSKSQSADIAKVALQQLKQLESEKRDSDVSKSVKGANAEALHGASSLQNIERSKQLAAVTTDVCDAKFQNLCANVSGGSVENIKIEGYSRSVDSASTRTSEQQTGQCTWKPAPGMKPKSLLEIQMEERMKSQTDTSVIENAALMNAIGLPTPWSGVVANPDSVKASNESVRGAGNNMSHLERSETTHEMKIKNSHLHDLLAEEVLNKSGEREASVSDSTFSLSSVGIASQAEPVDDDNFIEAKDTKRSRKKSAKSRNAAAKAVSTVSVDVPLGSSRTEKSKSSHTSVHDKEALPPVPAGPLLGDFVIWKGEQNSSHSPAPAWSTDSNKVPNKLSLRDILKEQKEKNGSAAVHQNQSPIPQKPHPAQGSRSTAALWSVPASPPSMSASPLEINAPSSQSKYKTDDELFWGPVDRSRQETDQSDFPHLAPSKGISLSRQKSASSKSNERLLSSSPAGVQSSLKGKRDAMTKHSEAMGFKDWCENECIRLIGTKDTSFLEYCLKQSRSEAEMLLKENLGSCDRDYEFIDKFLNYMEMLPSDVIEMAFQREFDRKFPLPGAIGTNSDNSDINDIDRDNNEGHDGLSKGGGKKKSKKGKKVSPSVLGFNVVSNRIMKGEIHTLEE